VSALAAGSHGSKNSIIVVASALDDPDGSAWAENALDGRRKWKVNGTHRIPELWQIVLIMGMTAFGGG